MKLKKLQLQNFRCFKSVELEFNKQMNCIAGVNGAGKTTILSAICKSMLIFINKNRLGKYEKKKYALNASDVYADKQTTSLKESVTAVSNLEFSANGKDESIEHSFKKQGGFGEYIASKYKGSGFEDAKNAPIFAFYSINRRNVSSKNKDTYDGIFSAWDNVSLLNFDCFFNWFKDELLREYQEKDKNSSYVSRELSVVKRAISNFFGESIEIRVYRETLIAIKNGVEILFSNLSDGEKSVLLLLSDIARRLVISNPNLENPLDGSGVVLIDEIEMHLHPSWQRKICKTLKESFPNCQFVITTHSPQVLGELKREEILLLNDFVVSRVFLASYGRSSNDILDEILDTDGDGLSQNVEISKRLDEVGRLVELEKFDEAKELILQIEKEAGGELHETLKYKTEIELLEVL